MADEERDEVTTGLGASAQADGDPGSTTGEPTETSEAPAPTPSDPGDESDK